MPESPERPADESLPPGVIREVKVPGGPTLRYLTAEEWERRTGMGDHISLGPPINAPRPVPDADAGLLVQCPACKGKGYFDETPGGGSTCIFCVGAGKVSSADVLRYDRRDSLFGAEPTVRRLQIAANQMYGGDIQDWLERYDFTLEQLEAEVDEDELDELWGYHGRNLAGRNFISQRRPDGTPYERWDEVNFSGSILTGANFHEVDLTEADFSDADLRDAILTGANLTRVSFDEANLSGANLDAAILFGADLNRANLSGASLRGASLVDACLSGTTLDTADVTGADFRGVENLDRNALADLQTRGAVVDEPAP